MFGLENQKKKKDDVFIFELENEFKDNKKHKELKRRIEEQIQKIKTKLQTGEDKKEFDEFGVLLYGYTSLLKVMARTIAKK